MLKRARWSFHPVSVGSDGRDGQNRRPFRVLPGAVRKAKRAGAALTNPGEAAQSRLLNLPGIRALLVWQDKTLRWVVLGGVKKQQGASRLEPGSKESDRS